ncbi:hypothetical protein CH330_04060 [candidate division WOR-3 bacterium JGI_Cruoil_03_51_56]|uniref:DUF4390 domain-containing protein n=1 Tax=candidate division WOR-3 bacterium JGI_Cruoil_03_51_56 TaxID=1973747 RepID=A0A235BU68_UNCW3|nr:MAG: hypothetical protein CH330_04060 [candidate division WOR-3 bacterium JGI_Cruoil_03_51_56]
MSFFLSLLAAKGLGALISSLLLLTQNTPGFSSPSLLVQNDTLYLETTLRHGFDKHLDQLLESGSLIAIGYTVTIFSRDDNGQISTVSLAFFHSALYDPVTKSYTVYRSELAGQPDSTITADKLSQAKRLLADISAPLVPASILPKGQQFSCRIEAALNTIGLEAMDGKELDLNVFWNYRYPKAVTPWKTAIKP